MILAILISLIPAVFAILIHRQDKEKAARQNRLQDEGLNDYAKAYIANQKAVNNANRIARLSK
tara:strand:- start:24 stop:212 length:189 start_codon:yes stop_codon:yes gene_type:complete